MTHPEKLALGLALMLIAGSASAATGTLLDDDFNNGNLATNDDTGGGFVIQDNGVNTIGSVSESGSSAQIIDGNGSNTTGIRSANAFDISNSSLTYTTTWEVDGLDFGSAGGIERVFFSLQTNDSWLFAGDAEESRLLVTVDAQSDNALFRYQDRSSGINANSDAPLFGLGGDFSGDADGFTATMTLDSTGFTFTTSGLGAPNQVNISGTWADLGTDFAAVLGTDGSMHVAAYVQDTGTTGSSFDIDRITLTSATAPDVPVISSFTADSSSVEAGGTVELSWEASNFDTLTLDPGGIDAAALTTEGGGSTVVTVNEATTYTLTATLGTESVQSQVTVNLQVVADRPNVLVFLVDDMGITDTSVPFIHDGSGNPVSYNFNNFYVTPNMEALASTGMTFTQAYATPACSSTRVSLMTGFNTLRHGVCMQVNPAGVIAPNAVAPFTTTHSTPNNWRSTGMAAADASTSMPKVLSDAGYRSIHCGKGHFGSNGSYASDPLAVGFDVNLGGSYRGQPPSYTGNYGGDLPNMDPWENTGTFLTDALTQAINSAIEDAVNDGVPFFGYMSHYAVHSPFTTDPNATGDYSTGVNSNHRAFATMIEGMDQSLGGILTKLDQLGVAENTLVIFLGDNGSDSPAATPDGFASGSFSDFPLRGKKATEWEGGIRVPMLVSWAKPDPGNAFQTALPIAAGSRQDDIVTVWDIFPTVLGVTGVTPPHALDGHDLSPYLQGTPGTHRPQEMLMYWPNDHNEDYFAIYREENWKLIYRFAPDSFELYDLDADPTESVDVSGTNPERVMTMARGMARSFDGGWGPLGTLWPTFNESSRPYSDDPFHTPQLPTVDVDMDGIPDNDEDINDNGLVDNGETSADKSDTDGDSTGDGAEVRLGLDPLDPTEAFRATITPLQAGDFRLSWPSAPGTSFQIHGSSGLTEWLPFGGIVSADAGTETIREITIPGSPDNYFFEIELLP
ncbi:hypothetical protein HAHE_32730 [Haloferula helveola]|uniref:Sulfatase N-terminal domain-containing protein n=1 Tax=Haloferula helveola TaxID=490095 RepID=A0ABN6H6T5_9BACT|nr:hypothetical protein HAHE_32730 [Haloferula helveola]